MPVAAYIRKNFLSLSPMRTLLLLPAFILASQAASADEPLQSAAGSTFRSFELAPGQPNEARRMLRDLLGTRIREAQILADDETGRLILQAPADILELAEQLAEELRKEPQNTPAATQPPQIRTYPVARGTAENSAAEIRQAVGTAARVTANSSGTALIVRAAPGIHDQISTLLAEMPPVTAPFERKRSAAEVIPSGLPPRGLPQDASAAAPDQLTANDYQLRAISIEQCRRALERLLAERLQKLQAGQYSYSGTNNRIALIRLDEARKKVECFGAPDLQKQVLALVRSFDQSAMSSTETTVRFLPVRGVDPAILRRALQLWRPADPSGARSTERPQSAVQPAAWSNPSWQDSGTILQTSANQPFDEISLEGANNTPPSSVPEMRRPSSDVDVETLPDLDVMILRGRDPDVDELIEIIREIERLSEETAPEIELYRLQHVEGEALESLIDDVLEDLTGPLQGRITIRPLVKPNALLLIGWGEAVEAAKKLIAELDQPVMPDTQLQVFHLRYAPASDLQTTIEQFLNGRGGLGPQVNVAVNTRTNSLLVNAAPRDLKEVARLIEQMDVRTSESVNEAIIISLGNALAADVAATVEEALTAARGGGNGRSAALQMMMVTPGGEQVVRSGLLDDVQLTPDTRTNRIFVTGPPESLPLVEQFIRQLDESPTSAAQLKVFPVRNGDAGDLVTILRSLFPEAAGTSTVPSLATAEGETSLVPVRFSVDQRTNSIIATGAAGDLEVVEALLLRLDQTESQERINEVYKLRNSPAIDVARAVNDFLRSERIVAQAAPGRQNPFEQIEQEVVVVPEPVGNALIISATPRYFDEILELVESLDEQPPQVMIQVILAEVELDNTHEFGVELGLQDSLLFDRSLLGDLTTTTQTITTSTPAGVITDTSQIIQAATLTPGFDFNNNPLGNSGSQLSRSTANDVAGQALSSFSLGRTNSELGYGGLVLSASSANVSVLLRALNESRNLEILSRPQIMTLDNQPAFIQVGQRVPRIVGTQLNQIGQVNSVELENVGLILGVTPRISPDGMVVMEIDAEKSELGTEQEGIPISISNDGEIIRSPRVNITTAQTTVSAASGQTVVIGGLITTNNLSVSRKVPWLGDLPVLGKVFRYDGHSHTRKELLIILTPRVVRGEGEAEYLKQVEMSRMSWMSSDVYDWLSDTSVTAFDTSGSDVPVIYPDHNPVPDWNGELPVTPAPPEGSASTVPASVPQIPPAEPQDSGVRKASFFRRLSGGGK